MANSGSLVKFSDDVEPAADVDELNRSGLSHVDESGVSSSGSLRTNPAGAVLMAPALESSSNENTPLLLRSDNFHVGIISANYDADDREFGRIFNDAEQAIDRGIYPQRISQGSSGSYFVKHSDGVSITTSVSCLTVTVVVMRDVMISSLQNKHKCTGCIKKVVA